MAERRIRFGVIGGGLMGREFASAAARWVHLADLGVRPEIAAVCDTSPDALAWFERLDPRPRLYADYRELLADESVEAVYCAVPHRLHEEVYLACLGAGKHLLGEKPFGIDLAANDAINAGIATHPALLAFGQAGGGDGFDVRLVLVLVQVIGAFFIVLVFVVALFVMAEMDLRPLHQTGKPLRARRKGYDAARDGHQAQARGQEGQRQAHKQQSQRQCPGQPRHLPHLRGMDGKPVRRDEPQKSSLVDALERTLSIRVLLDACLHESHVCIEFVRRVRRGGVRPRVRQDVAVDRRCVHRKLVE